MPYGSTLIQVMTPTEKLNLDQLLEQQDPDLLDWFLGKSMPAEPSIADAVRHVLSFINKREQAKEA